MSKKITEKFTERAKKALSLASKEAKQLGSTIIDTEHILLGILEDTSSIASKVLNSFQVDTKKIRETIVASTEKVEESKENDEDGFSEAAQEAIAAGTLQAYLWGSAYVGTEHLLCGLSKTPSGLACHVLRSWGITYESLKSKVESYTSYQQSTTVVKEPSTPLLNTYSRDLTALARSDLLDPVIGREREIKRVLQVLSRRTKNNPVLLGDAGVGKTAIAEGIAGRIVGKDVPQKFFDTRVVSLDINALVAGTRFRGDFEERLLGIIEEIKEAENIVLFIDEIHTIVGAGGAGGALDAANILKPALSRGELRCIGATTTEEYAQFIEEDAALERRFQPIIIDEPDITNTVNILDGLKIRYESFHGVKIKKNAIKTAAKLAARYITDRHLPDSAIDILDEAASKKSADATSLSKTAVKYEETLKSVREDKDQLVRHERYPDALKLREKEKILKAKLDKILAGKRKKNSKVDEQDIAEIVSMMTGIPTQDLTSSEAQKLLNLETEMSKKVVGQNHVLKQIASVIKRSRAGLRDPKRPIGSFIFLGGSGVGKTLVAQTLAEVMFDNPDSLVRLDMSEFSERHTVSRLVGAPPGYVGYEEGGELTEKLRHNPYSVILLDEIEKAHPEIFNTLLQVLDNGRLMDGKGRVVNFRNSIIIMTSNIGSSLITKEGDIGFGMKGDDNRSRESYYKNITSKLMEQLRRNFKIEFLNRIDATVVFKPLGAKNAKRIAKLLLSEIKDRLKEYRIKLNVENSVLDLLVKSGFSEEFGAREIRRAASEIIEEPLSDGIIASRFKKGQTVKISAEKDRIVFK